MLARNKVLVLVEAKLEDVGMKNLGCGVFKFGLYLIQEHKAVRLGTRSLHLTPSLHFPYTLNLITGFAHPDHE